MENNSLNGVYYISNLRRLGFTKEAFITSLIEGALELIKEEEFESKPLGIQGYEILDEKTKNIISNQNTKFGVNIESLLKLGRLNVNS